MEIEFARGLSNWTSQQADQEKENVVQELCNQEVYCFKVNCSDDVFVSLPEYCKESNITKFRFVLHFLHSAFMRMHLTSKICKHTVCN